VVRSASHGTSIRQGEEYDLAGPRLVVNEWAACLRPASFDALVSFSATLGRWLRLQAQYNHCDEVASEKCLAAATFVRHQLRVASLQVAPS
jgi:hypothetical protein